MQPDPRKIVAELIESAAVACYSGGGFDEWKDSDEYFATVCSDAADAVLAALRDAGWRPPEDVQDLTEKLEYATLQLDTAAAVGRALIAERDAARATIAVDRAAHGRLFLQRDEAITERDRLRAEVVETSAAYWREREASSRTQPVVDAARALIAAGARPGRELHIDGPILRETFRALVAAVDALDAQPKATGGVIEPGLMSVGEDPPAMVSYPTPADRYPTLSKLVAALRPVVEDALPPFSNVEREHPGTGVPMTAIECTPDGTEYELSSHLYLSTACLHATTEQGREHLHRYCQGVDGLAGRKKPAVCKFCDAPCTCDCHREESTDGN